MPIIRPATSPGFAHSYTMQRSTAVDILRAIAVCLVLGPHMRPMEPEGGSVVGAGIHHFTTLWWRGGWIGVDLFFVLSGFLVSGLLFREHQKFGALSAKNFLIRRGLKIYPAFWVLIGLTCGISLLRHRFEFKPLLSELLFIQNYSQGFWNHTWSLAVEEHFYFLLLLYLVFLSRRQSANAFQSIPTSFVVFAVLLLTLRLVVAGCLPYTYRTHHYPSHLRMDSLFCGVLISYYYHYHSARFFELARRYRVPALIFGVLALTPAFVFPLRTTHFIHTIGFTLFYVGSGLILVALLTVNLSKYKLARSIAYIGSHSYSIYLWHIPYARWVLPRVECMAGQYWSWPVYFALYFIGSQFFGIIMGLLVEFPVLRLRDRWFPSRVRPLTITNKWHK